MKRNAKQFSEELNKCLDDLDVPLASRERSLALSKMLNIPKQQAWALVEGQVFPDDDLLNKITHEFDMSIDSH